MKLRLHIDKYSGVNVEHAGHLYKIRQLHNVLHFLSQNNTYTNGTAQSH